MQSWLTATSASQIEAILLPQPPKYLGFTGTHQHTWLIFIFLVETGFHHVGQADLELLTLGDLPTSASQSAGIIATAPSLRVNKYMKEILGIFANIKKLTFLL